MLIRDTLRVVLVASILSLCFGGLVHAATFVVNDTMHTPGGSCGPTSSGYNCTFWQAILAANASPGHDDIYLFPGGTFKVPTPATLLGGVFPVGYPIISDDVTIHGQSAAVIGSPGSVAGMFFASAAVHMEIRDLTLKNAARAIHIEDELILDNVEISASGGPFIFSSPDVVYVAGDATITNTYIRNNIGTALYLPLNTGANVFIGESDFSYNDAGIHSLSGELVVEATDVHHNNGTGIYHGADTYSGALLTSISGCRISYNKNRGLELRSIASVNSSYITGNKGLYGAGALIGGSLASSTAQVDIFNSVISDNVAVYDSSIAPSGNGGGLYIDNTATRIEATTIERNSAEFDGAGIYVEGQGTPTLFSLSYSGVGNNEAGRNGGGVTIVAGQRDVSIANTSIIENTANTHGGGLYFPSSGPISSNIELVQTTIARNTAVTGSGGGIYRTGWLVDVGNSIIAENSAALAGSDSCRTISPSLPINSLGYNFIEGSPTSTVCAVSTPPLPTYDQYTGTGSTVIFAASSINAAPGAYYLPVSSGDTIDVIPAPLSTIEMWDQIFTSATVLSGPGIRDIGAYEIP